MRAVVFACVLDHVLLFHIAFLCFCGVIVVVVFLCVTLRMCGCVCNLCACVCFSGSFFSVCMYGCAWACQFVCTLYHMFVRTVRGHDCTLELCISCLT